MAGRRGTGYSLAGACLDGGWLETARELGAVTQQRHITIE
jgi:hypothetical protein